jgi:hypothetical protein
MALHVNVHIPISLYFYFLCRMVVGSIEDLPGWACLAALPDMSGRLEIDSTTKIYNFRRAPMVGVPIAEVTSTLVSWLCWMVSSYVGHLDTKTISLRLRALIPRSCNILVLLRPCQPSWAPWMRDLPRSVCSCSPGSLFWAPWILRRE